MSLRNRLAGHFMLHIAALVAAVIGVGALSVLLYVDRSVSPTPSGVATAQAVLVRAPRATRVRDGRVAVAASLLDRVRRAGGWLQVLDPSGRVVYGYRVPPGLPAHYAPGYLVYARLNPESIGYDLYTWYQTRRGGTLTWILGVRYSAPAAPAGTRLRLVATLVAASLLATVLVAIVFGWRLGTPLLHVLDWLGGLSEGRYEEPTDRHGRPRSRPRGAFRGTYRVYAEVLRTLEATAHALRRAERERKRLDGAREEWIAGVSHDLRTPLSSVKGYATLLAAPQYTWDPSDVRGFGELIGRQADHMEALIGDMNLSVRLQSGALALNRQDEDLAELARRAAIDLVNSPLAEGREVTFESLPDRIIYPVDAGWFRRALENFVANALVHNPEGTHVHVRVATAAGGARAPGVVIEIADDGVGMDEETRRHMFERYFRGTDTSDREGRGSGLGSAIALQLVAAHGGTVNVRSAPGAGTAVEIRLPPLA